MTKKSTSILLAIVIMMVMSFGSFTTAYAVESDEPSNPISPKMSYISTVLPTMSFSGSTASLNCVVQGIHGTTTKITVMGTLQRYVSGNWVNVSSSSQTRNYYRMTYSRNNSVSSGYIYRAKYRIKAYSGSAYEMRTIYSKSVELY